MYICYRLDIVMHKGTVVTTNVTFPLLQIFVLLALLSLGFFKVTVSLANPFTHYS